MCKKIILLLLSLIIMIVGMSSTSHFIEKDNEMVRVTGTVIGNTQTVKSHYKSTEVYTEYRLAIHPDDTKLYKDFDTKVSFTDACKYKVGDRIVIDEVYADTVMRNHPSYFTETTISLLITFLALMCFIATLFSLSDYY